MNAKLKVAALLLSLLTAACARESSFREFGDNEESVILAHFQKIQIGMDVDEVESFLGKPLFDLDRGEDGTSAYYWETPERALKPHESPYLASGMMLTFLNGAVSEKKFNHQWVNQTQLALFRERMKKGESY